MHHHSHHAQHGHHQGHDTHPAHHHSHLGHHGHHHHVAGAEGNRKALTTALLITAAIMLLEFFGGLITNSLALLSDAGHMLSDTTALVLSLVAVSFAARPASARNTFGYHRFEILAALFNGVTLFAVAAIIIWEAYHRLLDPPTVASGSMMLIASIGLIANLLSAWALMRQGDVHDNVNVRSAFLHVIGDALGSLGAIAAGLLMLLFSWYAADPIISVIVAILILRSAWGMIRHTVHVLMEGAPAAIDRDEVCKALESIPGVADVHDLHIWTITSGLDALSCHLRIGDNQDGQSILQRAIHLLAERFNIHHTTIQIETSDIEHQPCQV
ncbi:cation diffusion facilitator family transporter [Paenibacillus xerothermodurans]|uniref:cation diffusion facilitator family transporter n=1 Tax=Paenibacillus xerothermodurans TaxID=1977292 RepID=UPI001FB55C59|nr:cation diffusion facilitator family transporter [Paenibacillus xerothermodurans]